MHAALLTELRLGDANDAFGGIPAHVPAQSGDVLGRADDLVRIGVEISLLATYPVDLYQAVDAGDFDISLARFDRGLKSDPNFMMEPFGPDGFADDGGWAGPDRDRFDGLMNNDDCRARSRRRARA